MTNSPLPRSLSARLSPDEYRRRLALMLVQGGLNTSPIQSPWQGAARMAQAFMGGLLTRNLQNAPQGIAEAPPNVAGPPARSPAAPSAPIGSSGAHPAALKPFHGLPSFLPPGSFPQSSPPSPAAAPAQPGGATSLATTSPMRNYEQNEANPLDPEIMIPAAGDARPRYPRNINDVPSNQVAGSVHNWLDAGGDVSQLPPDAQEYVRWIMANVQAPGVG
jgi:hypothetical protein